MLVLAMETTSDTCSVAVADDAGIVCERAFRHRMRLSQRFMDDVAAVLADAGAAPKGLSAIAVSLGPGSFTGVRVGVTVAKVMADVLALPIIGVPTLEVLAWPHRMLPNITLVPVVRSRPGVVCAGFYRSEQAHLRLVREGALYTPREMATALEQVGDALLYGEYAPRWSAILKQETGIAIPCTDGDPPRASSVALMAMSRLREGSVDSPITLVPIYAAPPPIHEKKRVDDRVR